MDNLRQNDTLDTVFEQGYFDFMFSGEMKLTPDEMALRFLLDDLDYSKFDTALYRKGKVHPRKLCACLVYAYMNGVFSLRKVEAFCARNVFAISVLGLDNSIDHSTWSRFMGRNGEALTDLFYQMVIKLSRLGELGMDVVFQDGTKVESRAGRYTFVWKGALEKNIDKCVGRMKGLVNVAKGLALVDKELDVRDETVHSILVSLLEQLTQMYLDWDAPRGKGHRLDKRIRLKEQMEEEVSKLSAMENQLAEIGPDRNSMSKTDPDATFMRMKDDAMRNGQLKPAYNIQNAVDSGYVVACTVSSDRTDYNTLAPTLEEMEDRLPWTYRNFAADSGYDCVDNFRLLEQKGINAYIKPQDWEMGRKRKVAKDIGRYQNMKYDKDRDEFTCARGHKLVFVREKKTKHGTVSRTYACKRGCVSCPLRRQCMKTSRKRFKTFEAVIEHWEYRKKAYDLLEADKGVQMRLNRSIMAEGSFAQMKNNIGLRRFSHFGKKKILLIWILCAMASNIMHFASRCIEKGIIGTPAWYLPDDCNPESA